MVSQTEADNELKAWHSAALANNSLENNDLLIDFREKVMPDVVMASSTTARSKIRDFLQSRGVQTGKGSGMGIHIALSRLIINGNVGNKDDPTIPTQVTRVATSPSSAPIQGGHARANFAKAPRFEHDLYSGPRSKPLLNDVKRKFLSDCRIFSVPDSDRLSLITLVLKGEAKRHFDDTIIHNVSSVDQAFDKIQERFQTESTVRETLRRWNTLKFRTIATKYPDKPHTEILDILMSEAKDLQTLLGKEYNTPRQLRDCLERACEAEMFTSLLTGQSYTSDPEEYLARLHTCITEQERRTNLIPTLPLLGARSQSSNANYANDNYGSPLDLEATLDEDIESVVYYNRRQQPMFRRRILRNTRSLPPTNRYNYGPPNARRSESLPPRGSRTQPLKVPRLMQSTSKELNPRGSDGEIMLCHVCNSWFHLANNCPDRDRTRPPSLHRNFFNDAHPEDLDPPSDRTPTAIDITANPQHVPQIDVSPSTAGTPHTQASVTFAPQTNLIPNNDGHIQHNSQTLFTQAVSFSKKFTKTLCNGHICEENTSTIFHTLVDMFRTNPINANEFHGSDICNRILKFFKLRNVTIPNGRQFQGLCLDDGSTQTLSGIIEFYLYINQYKLNDVVIIRQVNHSVRFGGYSNAPYKCLAEAIFRLPITPYFYFDILVLLIEDDVPFLLGLQDQTKWKTIRDLSSNPPRLLFPLHGFSVPLVHKLGHLYIELPQNIVLYTTSELLRLHRNLGHPTPRAAFNALKSAYPLDTSQADYEKLKTIATNCLGCLKYARQPNRYRAILPDKISFNHDVVIDIMFIDSLMILHCICRHTHFSRAALIRSAHSTVLWETFMCIWVTPYLGTPYVLWVDQQKSMVSKEMHAVATSLGCKLQEIATEAHWSLVVERFHSPLRRIFRKIKFEFPNMRNNVLLDYAVMVMNHTVGPENYTPAILAFGAQPRIPIGDYEQTPQTVKQRFDIANIARLEYEAIVAKLRVTTAFKSAPPNEAILSAIPGDQIMVYRENRGFDGPYVFVQLDGKIVTALDSQGRYHKFHSTMCKPHPINDLSPAFFTTQQADMSFLVINVNDPKDPRFEDAKVKEVQGIINRGGFKPIRKSEIPKDAAIIGNRFVLTIKDPDTPMQRYKARLVLKGHKDPDRFNIASEAPVLMRFSIRIIISTSVIKFNCRLWVRDVIQAYMQAHKLNRLLFTPAPPQANLSNEMCLQVLNAHYGMVDAGSIWFETYYPTYTDKLKMTPTDIDPCLLYKKEKDNTVGITGLVTDDTLNTGTAEFYRSETQATKMFDTICHESLPMRFFGMDVFKHPLAHNGFVINQKDLINQCKQLSDNKIPTMTEFRKSRGRPIYIAQTTRPDVSYRASKLAQVTESELSLEHVRELNSLICYLQETADVALLFPKLDENSLQLQVYSDASYATSTSVSQLGIIVFLVDKDKRCHFINWSSVKCSRTTKSMLAAELYAFSAAFDQGYALKRLLRNSTYPSIHLYHSTDSKSIFDTITRSKKLKEMRLMTEVAEIRRAYKADEITNVAWITSANNPADGLTRSEHNQVLDRALRSGVLRHEVGEWICKN